MLSRPPALTVTEMHRRFGFAPGVCADCASLRELRALHAVCVDAVPQRDWYDPKHKWNRMSPACGQKRGKDD